MSISKPQNRDEFRQNILTRLGAPVIEINLAQEQIDIAIDDAFQYYHDRNHFAGVENMFLTWRITPEFAAAFSSFEVKQTNQGGSPNAKEPIPGRPTVSGPGMVAELTLISPGSGYPPNTRPLLEQTTSLETELEITTDGGTDITTDGGDEIVYETDSEGKGTGLLVNIGPERTTQNGITSVTIYNVGSDYEVGDIVSISASNTSGNPITPAKFEVSKIKTETPVSGAVPITIQNNYLVLPDDVVGVNGVMQSMYTDAMGIFPGGAAFPIMMGGLLGGNAACSDVGYDLVSYVAMREYLSLLEFLFFPPINYSFNSRTHRLFINSNNIRNGGGFYGSGNYGKMMAIDCMVRPSPDVYPDLFNDMWLKEYATALCRVQWGRNLTKFKEVMLPGGITMNGEQIFSSGREDVAKLIERFPMDWADPPLDEVG